MMLFLFMSGALVHGEREREEERERGRERAAVDE